MNWVFDWISILLWLFLGKKITHKLFTQSKFVFIFFTTIMVSLFFHANFVGILYGLRWLSYALLMWPIVQLGKVAFLEKIMRIFSAVFVSTCLIQYIFMPDMRWLYYFGWDDHYYRVIGLLLDPGFTGLILVFILIWLWETKSERLLQVFTLGSLLLTYSRASYLALFMAMIWLKKPLKFFVLCFLLIVILPRTSGGEGVKLERTSTVNARLLNWQGSWNTFVKNPILGIGFGSYRSDSSLLYVLATTGIIGFVAYLGYLKSLVKLGPTFGALMVHSLFLNSLFYPAVLMWIAFRLAIMENKKSELLS